MKMTPKTPPSAELAEEPRFHLFDFESCIRGNVREVTVYLPPQYLKEPSRRFSVFYLQDGQNLFDGQSSYVANRTWSAHTTSDALISRGLIEPIILVGVAHTGLNRVDEYTPTQDQLRGGAGASYGQMLIEELMPFVDRTYRTSTGPPSAALGGSSLGGLISLYLGLKYPEVFGKLAIMSPALWWDNCSILREMEKVEPRPNLQVWLDIGSEEGPRPVREADLLYRLMVERGWLPDRDIKFVRVEGGRHDEAAWGARLAHVLMFLFPNR